MHSIILFFILFAVVISATTHQKRQSYDPVPIPQPSPSNANPPSNSTTSNANASQVPQSVVTLPPEGGGTCYEDCYNPCYYTWWNLCYGLWYNETYENVTNPAYNFTTLCNFSSPWSNLTKSSIADEESIIQQSLCWNMWFNISTSAWNVSEEDNSTSDNEDGQWYNVTSGWRNVTEFCESPCKYGLLFTGLWIDYINYFVNSSLTCNVWNWNTSVWDTSVPHPWLDFSNPCFEFWLDICYQPYLTVPSQHGPSSQSGPSSSQPGPSSSQPGPSSYQPGPSSYQPGPSSYQPGPSSYQPGPSSYQPGPSSYQPGPSSSATKSSNNCSNVCYDLWYYVCYNPHNKTMFDNETFARSWENSTRPWKYTTQTTPCYDPWRGGRNISEFNRTWCDAARRSPNPFYNTNDFRTYISLCYCTRLQAEYPCMTDDEEYSYPYYTISTQ